MFADKDNGQTTMGAAFSGAGWEPPENKLLRIAKDALQRHPIDAAARRDYIFLSIGADVHAITALFKPFQRQAIERLEVQARAALVEERAKAAKADKSSGGQNSRETHAAVVPRSAGSGSSAASAPNVAPPEVQSAAPKQTQSAPTQSNRAPVYAPSKPAPKPSAPMSAEDRAAAVRVARVITHLDTFLVNGQPIGKVPVIEVLDWLESQKRQANTQQRLVNSKQFNIRYVELVTAGLPQTKEVVGHYIDGKKAEKLYAQAQAEFAGKEMADAA